jgi:hypothetical protein
MPPHDVNARVRAQSYFDGSRECAPALIAPQEQLSNGPFQSFEERVWPDAFLWIAHVHNSISDVTVLDASTLDFRVPLHTTSTSSSTWQSLPAYVSQHPSTNRRKRSTLSSALA